MWKRSVTYHLPVVLAFSLLLLVPFSALGQDEAPSQILFNNARIFDGKSETLTSGNVLVEGNLIKQVSSSPIRAAGAIAIDGGGRTLMPGQVKWSQV